MPPCSTSSRCWRCGSRPASWRAGSAIRRPSPARLRTRSCSALLYWRGFNLVFRVWLRPSTPEGRIAPVDDATAARLLVGLNVVVVLPMLGRQAVAFMLATGRRAGDDCGSHPLSCR